MTGRTIPVTRTDDSEVAGEATQELIKAKTDNLDIALSALRDALRGTSNKTNTDIVTALGQVVLAAGTATIGKVDQGAAGAAPWAQNLAQIGGASLSLGQKTAANSLSVAGASDGYFVVGGATPDGSAPTVGTYSVRIGGQDANGNKRTLLLKSGGELPTYSPALTVTENFNAALTASYQKVATTTAATKMLRMSAACNATAYDIEFQVVAAGAAAPSTAGQALLAGDDFPQGFPIGDIYARSATAQKLIVWSA